jgi:hypothetical protein
MVVGVVEVEKVVGVVGLRIIQTQGNFLPQRPEGTKMHEGISLLNLEPL